MKRFFVIQAVSIIAVANTAHAELTNSGILDQALKHYRSAAQGWQNAAQGAATSLFWSLATISLVWTMGQLALRRAELGEFFGEFVRFLLFTGFWAWMLNNGPAHAELIVNSMVRLAGSAGGNVSGQQVMSPSGVVDVGFHVVDRALTQSSILSPLDSAIGIVLSLIILIVLALVGVNMLVTLISCWIVAYGGLIVLGFGGSRWTSDMAVSYYRLVFSLALQVLAMVLLVGIGENFLRGYYTAMAKDVKLQEQAVLLVVSIVLLATVNRVPPLLGSLAGGAAAHHALGGATAGAALSTMGAAGALAATPAALVAMGTGWLAKAVAGGALRDVGNVASAFGSVGSGVLDALRPSENRNSAGGGSVFPAPAVESRAQSAIAGLSAQDGAATRAHGSGGEPGAGWTWPSMPGDSDGSPEDVDPGEVSSAPPQDTLASIDDPDLEGFQDESPLDSDDPGPTDSGETSMQEESASSYVTSDIALPNSSPRETGESDGGDTSPSMPPTSEEHQPSMGGGSERTLSGSNAGTSVPQGSTLPAATSTMMSGAPIGALAAGSSSGVRPEPASNVLGHAPPPAGFGSQPPPVAALASAIGRSSETAPPDLAFANSTTSELRKSSDVRPLEKLAQAAEGRDLPTASMTQTAIDLEAEVAAFRDRE